MLVHGFIVNLVAGTCMAAVATPISGHNLPYPPVAATPLWLVLLTTLGPPLLTALLGYIAGIATQRSIGIDPILEGWRRETCYTLRRRLT